MKVLFISYYYPPLGGVASIRSLKLTKYIVRQDVQPVILTVYHRLMNYPVDTTLLDEVSRSTPIYHAFAPDLSWVYKILYKMNYPAAVRYINNVLLCPGAEVLWLPFAKACLHMIFRQHPDIESVHISSGPPATLLLGPYIQEKYKVPYVCEFRDEWTNNPERINSTFPTSSQIREQEMEADLLMGASGVVYLTQIMKDNFQSRYDFLLAKPSAVIPNGYDDEDFSSYRPNIRSDAKLRIVYSGSFYDRRQPIPLWMAVRFLIDTGLLNPSDIEFHIIGKNDSAFVLGPYHRDEQIRGMITFRTFMSHRATIQEMAASDALLLYIPSGKNTDSVLTGKIFDYLRCRKPVLAVIPPKGLAAQYLNECGIGYIADHSDIPGIAHQLGSIYKQWKSGTIPGFDYDDSVIARFNRSNQATELKQLLVEAVSHARNKS